MTPINVSVSSLDDDTQVVSLEGELDIASSDAVERELARLEEAPPDTLVFDLTRLSFMDSTGLRLILSAQGRAVRDGRKIVLTRGPEPVQRLFELTELSSRLTFVSDVSEIRGRG